MAVSTYLDPWQPGAACVDRLWRVVADAKERVVALDLPSTDTNLASPCREVLHFSITLYRSVSRVADQVGARWVTVQTGHCHKRLATPGDLLSDVLAESLRTRCDDAQRLGLEIHVENVSGTMIEADREAVDFRDARDLF